LVSEGGRAGVCSSTAAQHNLGILDKNGGGVEKDAVQAVHWYRKAAVQGYAPAKHNLACMYGNGNGAAFSRTIAKQRRGGEWRRIRGTPMHTVASVK
jgi:TPR repeat protein